MKRIIIIYILAIILIAGLVALINIHFGAFSYITFPQKLHTALEGSNSFLMLVMFIACNLVYAKTKDERLIIMAGGFLIGSIFNCIHIITIKTFPFDSMSITNLQQKPSLIYLLLCNLILPSSIYAAIIHKPLPQIIPNFRLKVYSIYFLIFLTLTISPILIYHFLPGLTDRFNIIIHALEFINYSLYIMLAFMILNVRQASNMRFYPVFTTGLAISGLAGLFYINPSITPSNEILAHIFQAIGLIFLICGIHHFRMYAKFLRFKDELVAYLCLMLISFYVIFISLTSAIFHTVFPAFSAYIFIEFLLIFQFILYLLVNNITKPVTNLTEALSKYIPGEKPANIPVIRKDEIGLLTEKINAIAMLSWEKISEISKLMERERSIIRVFETMRRISNPNIIKNTIIDEVNQAINADKCFIALYDSVKSSFYYDDYSVHLPSKTLVDHDYINKDILKFEKFNYIFEGHIEINFANVEDYITKNSLKCTKRERFLRKNHIKSFYSIPINYADHLMGYLIIQYTSDYIELNKEDLSFLKAMANQLGMVIYQPTQ